MSNAYRVHYAPYLRAERVIASDPRFAGPREIAACKVRGRKDLTRIPSEVTCTTCISRANLTA